MKRWLRNLQQTHFFKSLVYFIIGVFSYPGIAIINKLKITGTENIENLPKRNVLFVSNHQTYFADVITMLHIFCAVMEKEEQIRISHLPAQSFYERKFCGRYRNDAQNLVEPFFYVGRSDHS